MYIELLVIGFVLYIIFGDYVEAKADMLSEQARAKRLENDKIEFGEEHEG